MDIEQTLSALEMVSEALNAAIASGSGQLSELLSRRDQLIRRIPVPLTSHDRKGVVLRLQRIHETGERARQHLRQNRTAGLSAIDRLRQVSSTLAPHQSDSTLDCLG